MIDFVHKTIVPMMGLETNINVLIFWAMDVLHPPAAQAGTPNEHVAHIRLFYHASHVRNLIASSSQDAQDAFVVLHQTLFDQVQDELSYLSDAVSPNNET